MRGEERRAASATPSTFRRASPKPAGGDEQVLRDVRVRDPHALARAPEAAPASWPLLSETGRPEWAVSSYRMAPLGPSRSVVGDPPDTHAIKSRARDRLLLRPPGPGAVGASPGRFVAVPRRPLRSRGRARPRLPKRLARRQRAARGSAPARRRRRLSRRDKPPAPDALRRFPFRDRAGADPPAAPRPAGGDKRDWLGRAGRDLGLCFLIRRHVSLSVC